MHVFILVKYQTVCSGYNYSHIFFFHSKKEKKKTKREWNAFSLFPTHTISVRKKKPKPPKETASPLRQFVAWSQFLELSNKSQKNSDYNGKADRHLTLMGQTEGTGEMLLLPHTEAHRLLTNALCVCFLVDNLPVHKQQKISQLLANSGRDISLIPVCHRFGQTLLTTDFNCGCYC